MKKLIIILFILPSLLYSQDTRQVEVKPITAIDFYLSLIEHIDDLEKNSSLRSKSTVRNFSKLFSKDALIFNDIVPSPNFGEQVSVEAYINLSKKLKRKRLSSRITITQLNTDVKALTEFNVGEKGSVSLNVSVDKFMSFKDKDANLVSKKGDIIDFLDWPFKDAGKIDLTYEIIIPKSDETKQEIIWKIEKISSLKKIHTRPLFYIPETRMLFSKENKKINADSITINKKSLFLKGEDIRYFTYSKEITKSTPIFIDGISENFVFKSVEKYNDFSNTLVFRQTMPTMASFNTHLNESIDFQGNNLKMINNELSSSFSLSFTCLPYQINGENVLWIKKLDEKINKFMLDKKLYKKLADKKIKKATNLNIAIGADLNLYQTNITSNNNNQIIQNTNESAIDEDGHTYTRISTTSDYIENSEFKFLKFGIATNASIEFNKINTEGKGKVTYLVNFIGKLSKGLNGKITSSRSANINYTGIYEDFNLIIGDDEQFERYNLGDYSIQSNSDIELNAPVFANLGFRVERIADIQEIKEIGLFVGVSSTFILGDFSTITPQNYISTNSNGLNSSFDIIEGFKLNSPFILSFGISKKL